MLQFSEKYMDVEAGNVKSLKLELLNKYPALASLQNFQLALNENYALEDDVIHENDVVAIIPPVSGG